MEAFSKAEGYDPAQLVALQAQNVSKRPLVIAEMRMDSECWLYKYDGSHTLEETLDLGRPILGIPLMKGRIEFLRISRQPVGWDLRKGAQAPPFIITSLGIDLRTEDNRHADFVVEETITPMEDDLQLLRFGLFNEVVTEKDVRLLKVTKVTDGQGRQLSFDQAKDFLMVALQTPTQRGKNLKLRFEYGGDFLIQPGGDSYWELGVRGDWFPESESMAGESYEFHGTVRTKGEWIAFLPGETVRRGKDGDWSLVETQSTKPICFATILGGKYSMDQETRDGLTIRIATYGGFKAGVGNRALKDQAFNIIGYYQTFLGPFPFKEFLIIEKNQWGYGQAPPGMMYITKEAFNQTMDWAVYFREGIRKRYAHEIAHQYWGIVVKMPSPEDQWITESFADYCAALYERDIKSEGQFQKSVAHWSSDANEASGKAPIPLANDIHLKEEFEGYKARTYLLYSKGPMLLYALHRELGDTQFLTFLKSIQTNFRWRFATTRKLFDLLAFMTKKDYTPFFDRYFWGLEMPTVNPKH